MSLEMNTSGDWVSKIDHILICALKEWSIFRKKLVTVNLLILFGIVNKFASVVSNLNRRNLVLIEITVE